MGNQEFEYLTLLNTVLTTGEKHTSRNAETLSIFNANLHFDLSRGFPLMTHKKMFFRGVVEELLFFIRGDTDTKILEDKGIYIWKGNTDREFLNKMGFDYKEGLMGPNYGYNWRSFGSMYNPKDGTPLHPGVDQLKNVIDTIRKDPHSRRILLTSYDPMTVSQCVLYPCHTVIAQFHVERGDSDNHQCLCKKDKLNMFCYIRSSDLFLGLPFNIASSALLLSFIASITDKIPGKLHITLGDAHIYTAHIDAVKTAISRAGELFDFPIIDIPKLDSIEQLENLKFSDINLYGYKSHDTITAPMLP
jgi:thymidylate synthase